MPCLARFIGVNTGLILATESESELAGVLAHEVGHVQQRHIARMYEHMGRLQISTIASMIAAVLIATQNPQMGTGAMAAALARNQQALIDFTREHEKEADYVGIHTLNNAGFDPMGMPAFFPPHVAETSTIMAIKRQNIYKPIRSPKRVYWQRMAAPRVFLIVKYPIACLYSLIQARIRMQSFSTPHEASIYFAKILERGNHRNRVGILYGYVLSLIEEGKVNEAKPHLAELLQHSANQPLFQLAQVQMDMASGQYQEGLTRLASTLKNHPTNYALFVSYNEWLIKLGEADKAIPMLKQRASFKTSRPELWRLLSAAYATAKQPARAHLAQAEYLTLQEDFHGAVIQLRLAKKLPSLTAQDRKLIDSQLRDIQNKHPTIK